MNVTLIHGQNHQGSTYHIARMTAEKIGDSITEFFLPRDCGEGCFGCFACMNQGREHCPHYSQIETIFRSMLSADVIIIGSPTYVLEMTGHLKSFFDHLFSAWLSHRPERLMFSKTAVVVSTAAGVGAKGVAKSLARQLFWLGVPKIYKLPARVAATSWNDAKGKEKINAKAGRIAGRIVQSKGRARPGVKLMFMFYMMRQMQKSNQWAPLDQKHWRDQKWLGKDRPWKPST